jgi:hypothetical protein
MKLAWTQDGDNRWTGHAETLQNPVTIEYDPAFGTSRPYFAEGSQYAHPTLKAAKIAASRIADRLYAEQEMRDA